MNTKIRNILYGYKFENGSITIDNTEAEIVNQVFADYVKGLSLLKIANMLNQKGIEYLPNQVNWNKGKIKRMIEDKRYLGEDSYCENDPVNNSDPIGTLSPKTWIIIGSAIVGGIYKVVDYLVHTAKNSRTVKNAVIAFVKGVIAGGVVGLIIAYGSNTTIRNAIIGAIGGVCSYTANALKNKSFKVNAFINAAFSGFVSGALASKLTSKIKSQNVQDIASTIVGGIAGGLLDW